MEESQEEKYLGDQIHTDRLAPSIVRTIKKHIRKCIAKLNEIINLSEHPRMMRMGNSRCARTLYVSEQVTSILNNSESWIGISAEALDKLQDFQNRFMLRLFEAPKQGTPSEIVELDANMLLN